MATRRLAAVPLAVALVAPAAQAAITVDYSAVTTYSNSGWFTGLFIDETSASGSALGQTANLSGNRTITDSLFWRYDDIQDKTVPRSDTTGIAFLWGGALNNPSASEGDALIANLSLAVDYTHTQANQYDSPNINYRLIVGYSADPYAIDYGYIQSPSNNGSSTDTYGWPDNTASPIDFSTTLQMDLYGGEEANYWYAVLTVNWENEYANSWYWDDDYSKLNGDTFNATPNLTFTAVSASAVPEPAHYVLGLSLLSLLAAMRRRRQLRAS